MKIRNTILFCLMLAGCRWPEKPKPEPDPPTPRPSTMRFVIDFDGGTRSEAMRQRKSLTGGDVIGGVDFAQIAYWPDGISGRIETLADVQSDFKSAVCDRVKRGLLTIANLEPTTVEVGDAAVAFPVATVCWVTDDAPPEGKKYFGITHRIDKGNLTWVAEECWCFTQFHVWATESSKLDFREVVSFYAHTITHEYGHCLGFGHSDDCGNRSGGDGQRDVMRVFKGVTPWYVDGQWAFLWEQNTNPYGYPQGIDYDCVSKVGGVAN